MTDLTAQPSGEELLPELQERFRGGDDAVLDEIIECCAPVIRRLVYRLLAWEGDVEDVTQDVFAAMVAHRRRFRADASLRTWLYAIAVNTCRTRNRRIGCWKKFISITILNGGWRRPESPLALSLGREKARAVRAAVGRLPMKYRDVVVLYYLEELATDEILRILKISEKAFYTRLNRARNQLQILLADYADDKDE